MDISAALAALGKRSRGIKPKARYHFIHIPKNGGYSVRTALKRRGDVSVSEPFHFRYVDIAHKVGADLQFFCIVRNPWSRTASRYQFAIQNSKSWSANDPRRVYITKANFEDYVKDQRIFPIPEHPEQPWMGPMNSWFNQLEWIRDEDNNIVCDCLRFEHLQQDLNQYLGGKVRLRRENATQARYDYRNMYTDELAEIIATTFEDDIRHFGFTFDGAATRNVATL